MNRSGRRVGALMIVLAAVAVSACGGDGEDGAAAAQPRGGPARPGGPGAANRIVPVEVVPVEQGDIARSVTVSGVIEPIRTVAVNAQAAGALIAVNVEEGSMVGRGALLARIDERELAAQLGAAEANLQVAQAAYERAQQLRDRRVITLPEYERDRAAYAAAQAQVEQLRTRIGYATVNAPVAGIVTEKLVERGDIVSNNTRLFTIADISTMVVRVGVSELDVVELQPGDTVAVGLDAFPGRQLRGTVRRVFPSADPTTRLVPVEVALDAASARVARPGFLARATFDLSARENVLLLPASALLGGQGSQSVFVIEGDKAVRRTVETGLTSAGRVEIVAGLDGSETVVTAGNTMLRDGAQVRISSAAGTAPPAQRGGQ